VRWHSQPETRFDLGLLTEEERVLLWRYMFDTGRCAIEADDEQNLINSSCFPVTFEVLEFAQNATPEQLKAAGLSADSIDELSVSRQVELTHLRPVYIVDDTGDALMAIYHHLYD
jgi:hypothetical protein